MLTFDAEQHRYFWDGKPVANVARVLAELTDYSVIPAATLEVARQKGVAVHTMLDLDEKKDLDEETLPDWLKPVLAKWRQFVKETGFVTRASESRVYHPLYKFAGTLDRYGHMAMIGGFAFVDFKRSFLAGKVIGLQLAAYRAAYAEQVPEAKKAVLFALRINENTPVRLKEYNDPACFSEFLALLTAQRIREKYK